MQPLGMQLATTGGPSAGFRSRLRMPHVVMMGVLAVAAAIVGTFLVAPAQKAAADNGVAVLLISDGANNNCSVRMVSIRSDADNAVGSRVASSLGWRTWVGPNGQSIYESLKTACPGGDHRRILQAGATRNLMAVSAAISVALVTSVALPDLIVEGFEATGVTLPRDRAVAVSQCIGAGVGTLYGAMVSGSPAERRVADAAVSCLKAGVSGYVRGPETVRNFFQYMGTFVSTARYEDSALTATRGAVAAFQSSGVDVGITNQGFSWALQTSLRMIREAGARA